MHRWYPYVGPAHRRSLATGNSPRQHIGGAADVLDWECRHDDDSSDGSLTVTYVVLPDGLWIAGRHSEHVACARGAEVLAAGEMTFDVSDGVAVAEVSNQSTGYCPPPDCWPAVAAVLDAAKIANPGEFTLPITFRRCPACAAINIVKDDWFYCDLCNTALPADWNIGGL